MATRPARKIHSDPTDVSDEEWEFCASYLTLMKEDAPQREYGLRAVRGWLAAKQVLGFRTAGLLTAEAGAGVGGLAILGAPAELETVITRERITQVIMPELPATPTGHHEFIGITERLGVRFLMCSNLEEVLGHPVVHVDDDGLRFITLREEPLQNPLNRVLKRLLDLAVSIPVVFFLLPPLGVVVWLLQRRPSPGQLFYRQVRAGLQNRHFETIKFRTMHTDHGCTAQQATRDDPRIFPAGRWMRRMSIDELPQFLNDLRGEMSVTGPRPHLVEHNAQFAEQMANYHVRTFVKPGIIGLAQLRGFRGEARTAEEIAQRLASDLSYLEN